MNERAPKDQRSRILLFESRIAQIPPFTNSKGRRLKIFKTGIFGSKKFTASEMMSLLPQLLFALGSDNETFFTETGLSDNIRECIKSLQRVVKKIFSYDAFTERDLSELELEIKEMKSIWIKTFKQISKSELMFPKFHQLDHFPHWIRLFGNPRSYDTATFESVHKEFAKIPFAQSSKREKTYVKEMMNNVLAQEYLKMNTFTPQRKQVDRLDLRLIIESELKLYQNSIRMMTKLLDLPYDLYLRMLLYRSAYIPELGLIKCLELQKNIQEIGDTVQVRWEGRDVRDDIWCGQVRLLFKYKGTLKIFLQNYDYYISSRKINRKLGCFQLKQTNVKRLKSYSVLNITQIIRKVHIVPDFDKPGIFFVSSELLLLDEEV